MVPGTDCTVSFAVSRLRSGEIIELSLVLPRRARFELETGGMTDAVELRVVGVSPVWVVWVGVLYGAIAVVLDGGSTGDFRLRSLLNSEYPVPYCKQ